MSAPDVALAETFAAVARTLLAEQDEKATLRKICQLAMATIDGCEHAGMSLVKGRRVEPLDVSDDVSERLDAVQTEIGQGPCFDAIRHKGVFRSGRLSTEARWPAFSRRAHDETGVESAMGFQLFVDEETMGALNLYSSQPDAFDDHDQAVGAVFAAHAAVAMWNARRIDQLDHKATSRDVIGQAKGILMAREDISEDDAFDLLRRASQRLNVKLRDVAGRVAQGEAAGQDGDG